MGNRTTIKTQISEHDKQVIREFILWLCEKYEILEPEEDGYTLYGDMKYHSSDEILKEYFNENRKQLMSIDEAKR